MKITWGAADLVRLLRLGRWLAALATLGLVGPHASAAGSCVQYGEALNGLTGIMQIRTFFGPPGYGENPVTDRREAQGILFLDRPICTVANEKTYEQAEANQIEVTLVPDSGPRVNFADFAGKRVSVHGKLFHGFTGHHRTPLLLELSGIPVLTADQSFDPSVTPSNECYGC